MAFFLDNFEVLAHAPNGIKHLQEMILQLAVMGKLVPQEPDDEPASLLLEKIKKEKEQLIKAGKIKKQKSLPPIKEEEIPYELPKGWEWVRIEDICLLVTDGTHHTPKYLLEGIPFLSVKDISSGKIDFSNTKYISENEHEHLIKRCHPEYGDILLTKVGTTGIAKAIDVKKDFSLFVSVALLKLPKNQLSSNYIEKLLNSPLVRKYSKEGTEGVGNKNLVLRKIKAFTIPLPPLNEQKRIVERVDRLLALCDELEKNKEKQNKKQVSLNNASLEKLLSARSPEEFQNHWRRVADNFHLLYSNPENVAKLKQAILQLAVMGKLVPQEPGEEPAALLLEKIKKEKELLIKGGKIKKQKPLPPIPDDEKPYLLPKGWEWVRFGTITYSRDAERIPLSKEQRLTIQGPYDYYGASGVIDKINDYLFDCPLLLIGEDGANLINRSTPIAFIAKGKYWVNNHAHVLDGISLDFLHYLCLYINAISLKQYVTGTAQPKMNQTKMNSIPTSLPPLNEQHRIVSRVEELLTLCDGLEETLRKTETKSERLCKASAKSLAF